MSNRLLLAAFVLLLAACATGKPVVYPNAHSRAVGQAQLEADILECGRLAESAGANSSNQAVNRAAKRTVRGGGVGAATGAVGGAIAGNAGRGAAIGAASGATAGLLHSLLGETTPNSTYRSFVTRCLADRGYEVVGWN
ncbi:MAG: glycine zipper family protein [Gammaproteobacteria bacterium]